ncbi:MAG: hypothetical protein LBS65_03500, partial [Desulfovibrio sp.]|nr:hypothetical protein [Desulfovibrio sp.]
MKPKNFALRAICLGFVAAMLCACSNDAAKNAEWEKKQKEVIENFIASTNGTLKVGSIAVSALDKSFTLGNVTGSVPVNFAVPGSDPARGMVEFSAARVRGEGLNIAEAPEAADTLRKLIITDCVSKLETFSNDPPPEQGKSAPEVIFTSKDSASEYTYSDVKGDFSAFEELLSGSLGKEVVKKLAGFSIGEGTAKNYRIENFSPGIGSGAEGKALSAYATVSSLSYKSASVDGVGPSEMKNVELFFENNRILSLETLSFKRFAMPGLLMKVFPMDGLLQKNDEELQQLVLDQEIVVDDMRVANLRVSPESDSTVTVRDAGLTFRRVKPAGALKLDIQDLAIPLEALSGEGDEGEKQFDFKSIYDKPLSISLIFDLDGEEKANQAGEYAIRLNKVYFAESNLGNVNISAEVDRKKNEQAEESEYPFDPDEFSLVRAALGIKDSGMVDLGFRAASLMGGTGMSKEEGGALMRKLAGFVLTTQCVKFSKALQGVCVDLDKFIQVPGEFELTYAPAQPLSF